MDFDILKTLKRKVHPISGQCSLPISVENTGKPEVLRCSQRVKKGTSDKNRGKLLKSCLKWINPFHANVPFLYLLKTS